MPPVRAGTARRADRLTCRAKAAQQALIEGWFAGLAGCPTRSLTPASGLRLQTCRAPSPCR